LISSATPSQRGIGTGPATPGGSEPRHDQIPAAKTPSVEDFSAFFHDTYGNLIKFLLRLGGELGEAEEAAQNAMIDVYGSWNRIERPDAYVFVAAQRALFRARQRSRELLPRLISTGALERQNDREPEIAAADQQDAKQVLEILEELPRRQREVVALRIDGFGISEIAELLGLTQTAVRSNLYKARQNLTKRIDQLGFVHRESATQPT
jgi:RNA polymerase sigma factor (sigma-70 family)